MVNSWNRDFCNGNDKDIHADVCNLSLFLFMGHILLHFNPGTPGISTIKFAINFDRTHLTKFNYCACKIVASSKASDNTARI